VRKGLAQAGIEYLAWSHGERADVPDVMRGLDCFVLPSLAEGISNTILQAMASDLPVIAADFGGNAQLVDGRTGELEAMAASIAGMAGGLLRAAVMGTQARVQAERHLSRPARVDADRQPYDRMLAERHTTPRLD